MVAGARAQLAYDELSREAAALRALGKCSGTLYVVDRDKKRVVWAADREHGIDWDAGRRRPSRTSSSTPPSSRSRRSAKGDALPTPPRLPTGAVVAVARSRTTRSSAARAAPWCASRRTKKRPRRSRAFSKREREIARLLVAGYSGVNVAAISGLSENTVRTYVRRLYGKLGVSNRADLVRKLVPPEPKSSAPSSQIAPPPDSSLREGDDTLD